MRHEDIVSKIRGTYEKFEKRKEEEVILVMSPSTMHTVRDNITRYQDIHNTREAFVFDNKVPVYVSFELPPNHFIVTTRREYKESGE